MLLVSDMGVMGGFPIKETLLIRWEGTVQDVQRFQAIVVDSVEIGHKDVRAHRQAERMLKMH